MLSDNHICKVQAQKFAMLQEDYMRLEISKPRCSLIMSLHEMFLKDSDLCFMYACEAYRYFINSNKCDSDDFQSSYEQIATYGVLLSSICWGYDLSKNSMSLYTTSVGLLEQLAQRGILFGKKEPIQVELTQLRKVLYDSDRIKKTIRDGRKLVAVRIDMEVHGNSLVATFTMPRTLISLDTHIMVPFAGYQRAVELIHKELQRNILRVTMGDKVRDVTLNMGVLNSIYGEEHAKNLVSHLPDMYTQRFYVPSVGASKYTAGVTNLRLTEVDRVEPVSLADIDLSEVNMNYAMVNDFYLRAIGGMSEAQLKRACKAFDIEVNGVAEMRDSLALVVDTMYPRDIWNVMKENDELFHVGEYKNMPNKFGDKFEKIAIPSSEDELRKLFDTGVFKVLITKRNGQFSTVIGSNSIASLERIYGGSYWQFESDGVKLKELSRRMKNGKMDISAAQGVIKEMHMEELVYAQSMKELEEQIRLQKYNVEMNKTVVKQSKLVLLRSLEARDKSQYYKYIDLRSIVEIYRLV